MDSRGVSDSDRRLSRRPAARGRGPLLVLVLLAALLFISGFAAALPAFASSITVKATSAGTSPLRSRPLPAKITALETPAASSVRTHGLGLKVPKSAARHPARLAGALATLPASYSLQQYAPAPGDQGQLGSCAAWATAYTAMGVLENLDQAHGVWDNPLDRLPGGGGSAMYVYSQTCGGEDNGSYILDNVAVEASQGVDEQSDYAQGEADWQDPPTAQETANARNWVLAAGHNIGTDQYSIEQAISSNEPVVLGIEVTRAFGSNTSGSYPDPSNLDNDYSHLDGHALTAVGYDSGGLIVENSWGAYWGNGGFVHISWAWLEGTYQDSGWPDLTQATAMVGMRHCASVLTLASLNPTSGPAGMVVTIGGTGFTGTSLVSFNGAAATTFSVVSDTQITATVPSGATSGAVSVTAPGGTTTSATIFTVAATPAADTVGPVCAAANARVRHGRTCKLHFEVYDALSAQVTTELFITTRSGVVKKHWSWGYGENYAGWWSTRFACRLGRGTYRIAVTGSDLAGNGASVVGRARLVVR